MHCLVITFPIFTMRFDSLLSPVKINFMQSAVLHYSYSDVFPYLKKVCKRKGFHILKLNEESGEVIAERGWKILGNKSRIHFTLSKKSTLITQVNVEIMFDNIKKNKTDAGKFEEEVIHTIYKYF